MPQLQNEKYELFARAYVRSNNASLACQEAGYSKKSAGQGGARLLKISEIRARIEELRAELHANLDKVAILEKEWRARELQGMADSIKAIRKARKNDAIISRIPGGETGFVLLRASRTVTLPKDPNDPSKGTYSKVIFEGETDTALMSEYRAILLQGAREAGHLTEDKKGGGAANAGSTDRLNELFDVWKAGPAKPAEEEEKKAASSPSSTPGAADQTQGQQ